MAVPAGVREGQRIRLANQASAGQGDLFLTVEIVPDDRFELRGDDLYTRLRIRPHEAVLGARASCIPVENRDECWREEIIDKLERATGIFITGGNQLRLSTILGGTPVARTIRRRNAEGIPLAGTSAGAAIMSEHMIASGRSGPSPRESGVELAPGLGLTNRVIIDQHFSQRGRMGRLLSALSLNPFACGLGIDENTAAFMGPDGDLEVVGRGTVTVVDPAGLEHSSMSYVRKAQAVTLIGLKLHILAAGAHFNVETREARLA